MQFLWTWISRTETVGVTFLQNSPAYKKKSEDCHPTFIIEQMALFSASMRRISLSFWGERIWQYRH